MTTSARAPQTPPTSSRTGVTSPVSSNDGADTAGECRQGGQLGSPAAMPRNLVVVVLDSLRYDSWLAAAPPTLGRLGPVQRRWSYASWTAPSHYNQLMGLLPHASPTRVYASELYKQEFARYGERL